MKFMSAIWERHNSQIILKTVKIIIPSPNLSETNYDLGYSDFENRKKSERGFIMLAGSNENNQNVLKEIIYQNAFLMPCRLHLPCHDAEAMQHLCIYTRTHILLTIQGGPGHTNPSYAGLVLAQATNSMHEHPQI